MNIDRRDFLKTMIAAAAAPAIVRAESLMPIYVPKEQKIFTYDQVVLAMPDDSGIYIELTDMAGHVTRYDVTQGVSGTYWATIDKTQEVRDARLVSGNNEIIADMNAIYVQRGDTVSLNVIDID